QMFTHRWPDASTLNGAVGYGTYDTSNVYGGVSAGSQETRVTLNAGYFNTPRVSAPHASEALRDFNTGNHRYPNSKMARTTASRRTRSLGLPPSTRRATRSSTPAPPPMTPMTRRSACTPSTPATG